MPSWTTLFYLVALPVLLALVALGWLWRRFKASRRAESFTDYDGEAPELQWNSGVPVILKIIAIMIVAATIVSLNACGKSPEELTEYLFENGSGLVVAILIFSSVIALLPSRKTYQLRGDGIYTLGPGRAATAEMVVAFDEVLWFKPKFMGISFYPTLNTLAKQFSDAPEQDKPKWIPCGSSMRMIVLLLRDHGLAEQPPEDS